MRTTVDLDEDVLQAVREMAAQREASMGKVLSELARAALRGKDEPPAVRNGIPLLAKRSDGQLVTLEMVERLLDED